MQNPFIGQPDITSVDNLIGRAEKVSTLRSFVNRRVNSVLFGPEGCGKTALLNSVFSVAYRKQMAKKNVLIFLGEFPTGKTGEDTYGYFADAIRSSVEILEFCGRAEEQEMILGMLDRIQADSKKSRFDQYLAKIEMNEFKMVFVLDNFENFTSSPEIKAEHHDLLCGMLNSNRMQLIVASNYDFNATSLPPDIHNSLLLSRLSPNRIDIEPLDLEGSKACINQCLEENFCESPFSDEDLEELWKLSGGIPKLLNLAAQEAFDAKMAGDGEWMVTVEENTLEAAKPILKRWCKIMSDEQLSLLPRADNAAGYFTDDDIKAAKALEERGILYPEFSVTRSGQRRTGDGFRYNSRLLERFCRNAEWMEEAAQSNPLRREKEPMMSIDPMALLAGGANGGTIHIENLNIHNGDHIENTYQPTIVADNGFGKLFQLLDLGQEELGEQLRKLFNANITENLVLEPEEAAKRLTAMFVPPEIEEEEENLEQYQEEQKTLEGRFQEVRHKVDTNGLLDDALLDALSPKCRLYLQIAFVVEDCLSVLKDFHLGDLSANMVMYGKVLEQQLRDQLFNLFRGEVKLGTYDIYAYKYTPGSKKTFGRIGRNRACIGDFMHMIQDQQVYLGNLCHSNQVEHVDQEADDQWWDKLGIDINEARNLRNKTDHAGSETNQANLERMHTLLFGSGSILRRCFVGGELEEKLLLNPYERQGQTGEMVVDSITAQGGLVGTLKGTAYTVTVHKKDLDDSNLDANACLNTTFPVVLKHWKESKNGFNGDLAQ